MNDISREDALAHFGVRGMRWGVRKSTESSGPTKKQLKFRNKLDNLAPGESLRYGPRGRHTATHVPMDKPITLPDGKVVTSRLVLSKTNRADQARAATKFVGQTALRVGVVGLLSAVGMPAAVAGLGAVATVAANPELVTIGKENAKQFLDQHGIRSMSVVDKVKSAASETKARATVEAREINSTRIR